MHIVRPRCNNRTIIYETFISPVYGSISPFPPFTFTPDLLLPKHTHTHPCHTELQKGEIAKRPPHSHCLCVPVYCIVRLQSNEMLLLCDALRAGWWRCLFTLRARGLHCWETFCRPYGFLAPALLTI